MSLLILFLLTGLKSLQLRRIKSDWDEIWQDCSSSKYTSIDSRILDMTLNCQDDGNDVQLPLAAPYAVASAGCPLARRARVYSSCAVLHSYLLFHLVNLIPTRHICNIAALFHLS